MGLFDAFRVVPGPTLYDSIRTRAEADIVVAGILTAALLVYVAFLAILPSQSYSAFIRFTFALGVGLTILMCLFHESWRVGSVHTRTPLKQFTSTEVNATIGLHIGLKSFNVTVKGTPIVQRVDSSDEEIYYNEHFEFGILQGRLGFGPDAGLANQAFRDAQYRGKPLPVLWIAEYFTIDGERIRWGRAHRQAGYYTSALLWTALAFWVLTIPIIHMSISGGAYMMFLTGLTLMTSSGVYAHIHQDTSYPALKVPFADGTLEMKYGLAWYLALLFGAACMLLSSVVFFFYLFYPLVISDFMEFNIADDGDIELELFQQVHRSVKKASSRAATPGVISADLTKHDLSQVSSSRASARSDHERCSTWSATPDPEHILSVALASPNGKARDTSRYGSRDLEIRASTGDQSSASLRVEPLSQRSRSCQAHISSDIREESHNSPSSGPPSVLRLKALLPVTRPRTWSASSTLSAGSNTSKKSPRSLPPGKKVFKKGRKTQTGSVQQLQSSDRLVSLKLGSMSEDSLSL